jgi:hypothetical protein
LPLPAVPGLDGGTPEGRGHSGWTGTPPQDGALPCWHRHHKATPRDRDQGKEQNQPDPEYFTHQNNVPTNSYRYYFAVLQSNSTCGIINQCDFDLRWIMTQACGSTKKLSATFVARRFPLRSIAEWTGCATGLTGAGVLALNASFSGWGFALFLVSNFFMLVYGLQIRSKGLILLQLGFTVTSITGLINWLRPF